MQNSARATLDLRPRSSCLLATVKSLLKAPHRFYPIYVRPHVEDYSNADTAFHSTRRGLPNTSPDIFLMVCTSIVFIRGPNAPDVDTLYYRQETGTTENRNPTTSTGKVLDKTRTEIPCRPKVATSPCPIRRKTLITTLLRICSLREKKPCELCQLLVYTIQNGENAVI